MESLAIFSWILEHTNKFSKDDIGKRPLLGVPKINMKFMILNTKPMNPYMDIGEVTSDK